MTMVIGTKDSTVHSVRSVTRALAILSSFSGKGQQSLGEISALTGLDKGTTRRLLITLIRDNFVSQDVVSHRYRLGGAIHELAANIVDRPDLREIARPTLLELATNLGVTVFLSVFREGNAVCLDRFHDIRGIEVHWWAVGGTMPLNCGAAPKVLLSYRNELEIDQYLNEPLTELSGQTITEPKKIKQRLAMIRERGWECAVDDVAVGLSAVAVPVFDQQDIPICVISIAGLTPQLVRDDKPVHLQQLQVAAHQIQISL